MSLFLHFPAFPAQGINRGYVAGYSISGNFLSAPTLTDSTLDYTDVFNVRYHIELLPAFPPFSSNTYTQSYLIDVPNSHCYIGVTEVISGVFTTMGRIINERGLWFNMVSGGGAGPVYLHAFSPPPSTYWLPLN